jgi:hypothetical protein
MGEHTCTYVRTRVRTCDMALLPVPKWYHGTNTRDHLVHVYGHVYVPWCMVYHYMVHVYHGTVMIPSGMPYRVPIAGSTARHVDVPATTMVYACELSVISKTTRNPSTQVRRANSWAGVVSIEDSTVYYGSNSTARSAGTYVYQYVYVDMYMTDDWMGSSRKGSTASVIRVCSQVGETLHHGVDGQGEEGARGAACPPRCALGTRLHACNHLSRIYLRDALLVQLAAHYC